MRALILATASVLALGIGGAGAATAWNGHSGSAMGPNMGTMSPSGTSSWHRSSAHRTSTSSVKQAQEALRHDGLYHGAIDGVVGPKTRQALARFQKENGLRVTANLDSSTMASLMGRGTTGYGSSQMHSHMTPSQGNTSGQMPSQTPPETGNNGSGTMNTGTSTGTNTGTTR